MGVNETDFDSFEQILLEFIGDFQSTSASESRLRETLRAECARADGAEAARAASERAAAESRAGTAAATAGATHAAAALAKAHDELAPLKMQLEITERQHAILEERYTEQCKQLAAMEREIQQLRSLQTSHCSLQRQYHELQDRVRLTAEQVKAESARLEAELRRVERCAGAGAELRERARLAAAAHAQERRLAQADLHHTTSVLRNANSELARLHNVITDLQCRLAQSESISAISRYSNTITNDSDALNEARAALKAERSGAAKLEKALSAALAVNAELASRVKAEDTCNQPVAAQTSSAGINSTNITALDDFLAD